MELEKIMQYNNFVVVGDTLNEEKYAYKIKEGLINQGYNVEAVGKELPSLNDVVKDIDVIDLCINPIKGLMLLRECKKDFRVVLIQPGAESSEIIQYLNDSKIDYLEGCALVGMKLYKRK